MTVRTSSLPVRYWENVFIAVTLFITWPNYCMYAQMYINKYYITLPFNLSSFHAKWLGHLLDLHKIYYFSTVFYFNVKFYFLFSDSLGIELVICFLFTSCLGAWAGYFLLHGVTTKYLIQKRWLPLTLNLFTTIKWFSCSKRDVTVLQGPTVARDVQEQMKLFVRTSTRKSQLEDHFLQLVN